MRQVEKRLLNLSVPYDAQKSVITRTDQLNSIDVGSVGTNFDERLREFGLFYSDQLLNQSTGLS